MGRMNVKCQIMVKILKKLMTRHGVCGLFNTKCLVNDDFEVLFEHKGYQLRYCKSWDYFEVLGLPTDDFKEIECFYNLVVSEILNE